MVEFNSGLDYRLNFFLLGFVGQGGVTFKTRLANIRRKTRLKEQERETYTKEYRNNEGGMPVHLD